MNYMTPSIKMLQMITGYRISQAIYAAAKLGIADLLKEGPKNYIELAEATKTHPPSLFRLLRALAGVEIFKEDKNGYFSTTNLANTLKDDKIGSMRAFAIINGEECLKSWGDIIYSLKTGNSAFDFQFGMENFQYYAQNSEAGSNFNKSMKGLSELVIDTISSCYNYSNIKKIVDIGGGHGILITSILKANPNTKGILFDLPHVSKGAKKQIEEAGLTDRCEIVSGDFFKPLPPGGDAYILKHIIHDWDNKHSKTILKNCHKAMVKKGKLLLVEVVIKPGNEFSYGKFLDLQMLIMRQGGRVRTENEFKTLFTETGFELTKFIPIQPPLCIIEGIRC